MYAALAVHDRQTRKSLISAGTDKVCAVGLVHLPTYIHAAYRYGGVYADLVLRV